MALIRRARTLAALGLALAGSSPSQPAQAAVAHVLRARAIGEPQTLDWNRASTWVEGFVIRNVMEGLVGVGKSLSAEPKLATSWTASADAKTYTFRLRAGVKWSDGESLNAQQFVDSWRRLLAPETGAKYASFLFDIEGAEAFHRGQLSDFSKVGVRALDDLTLQVRLRAPVTYWYWIPSFYATYPIRLDKVGNPSVTLGAFTVKSQDPRTIVLERNPLYYGRRGNIDEIDLALIADDSMALKLYEDGQIDFMPKLASLERERLRSRPDFRTWPDIRTIHLRLNTGHGPMANVDFRRAVALAIDRTKLAKLFDGAYRQATTLVPPGLMGFSPKGGLTFNLARAKDELKKSGFDPVHLPPLDLLSPSFDDQVILAQFIQDELRRNLGLTVRIHVLEPKRYYSPDLPNGDYAMQINFWGADFPDPDSFASIFLSNSGLNRYGWADPRYDELVTQARSAASGPEREKRYAAAQKVLLEEDVADVPLYYDQLVGLLRPRVSDFAPSPLSWGELKGLSVR